FGSHSDSSNKTEIVLLMTPRIVRNLARPDARYERFASGTEAAIGARPFAVHMAAPLQASMTPPSSKGPAVTLVTLQSPPTVPSGQEFTASVVLKGKLPIKQGLLDFAFDPSRLTFVRAESGSALQAADKDAELRTTVTA